MNRALCNECKTLVDAQVTERDGRMFLVKTCGDCGTTETLISGDSRRYLEKHDLDAGYPGQPCAMDCLVCRHRQHPTLIFVDITNRCNLNCPICINNTPAMGFLFEPPLGYFKRIFEHFAAYEPRPAIQLFGGEPTVRKDLFEIIQAAQDAGLAVRIVTNGVKLANEDYCRRIVETRATILIAYDGENREIYRRMRGTDKVLDKKRQAIANIRNTGQRAKVTFMTLVARGYNDRELPEIFQFAHDGRDVVRGIYLMPLAHTWDEKDFDLEADRITTEDVENMVDESYPDDRIDFMPASFLGSLDALLKCLNVKPLPFAGAHPNCESMYLLISDGEQYVPLARFIKTSGKEMCDALRGVDKRLAPIAPKGGQKAGAWVKLRAMVAMLRSLRRHTHIGRLFKGGGFFGKVYHVLAMAGGLLTGRKSRLVFERHTHMQGFLQVIILPFEDDSNVETDRLERCPASFAFFDPEAERVHSVPVCSWGRHKTAAMRKIAEHYGDPVEAPVAST